MYGFKEEQFLYCIIFFIEKWLISNPTSYLGLILIFVAFEGVGKSSLAATLSMTFSNMGKKVSTLIIIIIVIYNDFNFVDKMIILVNLTRIDD